MFLPYVQKFVSQFDLDPWLVEVPQDRTMGDFSVPCFTLAKAWKKAPQMIAEELAEKMNNKNIWNLDVKLRRLEIAKVEAVWPYINIFLNTAHMARQVIPKILEEADEYGRREIQAWERQKTIMIESPSPNTNKPLHLGHVRNMLLWNALYNIYTFLWRKAIRTDIVNDRGVHICKSMLMYEKYGNDETPEDAWIKSDHYVWQRYVRYATELKENPWLADEAQEMLQKREQWDSEVVALREKMRRWTLEWFKQTYDIYGVDMDAIYYESDIYKDGKQVVQDWVASSIFEQDETGAVFVDLETQWYDKKILQRSDGTAIYITQDMYLAKKRYDDYKMDRLVYVVWSEQEYHFAVLFEIFKLLWYSFAEDCFHMSYGMISLPDGKMKSREGNVVDADWLIEDMTQKVTVQMQWRNEITDNDIPNIAPKIAMWAIKFFILKFDSKKAFVFDRESSLNISWESWPYIQYTYVRCVSIREKIDWWMYNQVVDFSLYVESEEHHLLLCLSEFSKIVIDAWDKYQPYMIARYLLELAQQFNSFYQKHKVVTDDDALTQSRLALVSSVQHVLKNWLTLLWIDTIDRM